MYEFLFVPTPTTSEKSKSPNKCDTDSLSTIESDQESNAGEESKPKVKLIKQERKQLCSTQPKKNCKLSFNKAKFTSLDPNHRVRTQICMHANAGDQGISHRCQPMCSVLEDRLPNTQLSNWIVRWLLPLSSDKLPGAMEKKWQYVEQVEVNAVVVPPYCFIRSYEW